MEKKSFGVIVAAVVLAVFVSAGVSQAVPTNGDFSNGLSDWNPSGSVTDGDGDTTGFAFFNSENGSGSLFQDFTLPGDATTLSFEIKPLGEGAPGCDIFTASLTEHNDYYSWSNEAGGTEITEPGVEVALIEVDNQPWERVTLDVSLLAGQNVLLTFNLLSDNDELRSWISLDNVIVTGSAIVVPAPAAMILSAIGAGLVGLIRRTKILR